MNQQEAIQKLQQAFKEIEEGGFTVKPVFQVFQKVSNPKPDEATGTKEQGVEESIEGGESGVQEPKGE